MEYDIVTADDFDELIHRVNERIRFGWSVSGGPIVLPKRITTVRKDRGTVDEYENGHVECNVGQAMTRPSRHVTPPRQRKGITPT
jgi:hypothetical protein